MFPMTCFAALLLSVFLVAQAQCPHPSGTQETLPGLDGTLGHGFDLSTFSFPVRGTPQSPAGSCVVNMTLLEGSTWTDSYFKPPIPFLIWDQVDTVEATNTYIDKCNYLQINAMFEFTEWLYESVSSGGFFGLFSSSESFQEFFSAGFVNNMSYLQCHGFSSTYSISFVEMSHLQPSGYFLSDAEALPTLWMLPVNWPKWESHFSTYGTHFVFTGFFGGGFFYDTFIDSFYAHAAGDADLVLNAGADFLHFLSIDGSGSGGGSVASDAYLKASHTVVTCYGAEQYVGGCNNLRNDSAAFAQWLNAVPTSPYLYNAKFEVSSLLLPFPLQDIHLAATAAYIGWKGIDALENLLTLTASILTNYTQVVPFDCYCVTRTCTRGDNVSAVFANFTRNAKSLLNSTTSLLNEIATAKAKKQASLLLPASATLEDWMSVFYNITSSLFSSPRSFSCESAGFVSPYRECVGGCCWTGNEPLIWLHVGADMCMPCNQGPTPTTTTCGQTFLPSGML